MNQQGPVIRLDRVSKEFGGEAVLDGVSLDVRPGEFLTILGPSGCGKTTLLRLIAGFETPTSGEIFLDGAPVTGLPPNRRRVNTVFQSYALFPHMNVAKNVGFGLKMAGVAGPEADERVAKALATVNLESMAQRMPAELSGGQQQRVALARALVNNPLVLLLDEPLSALDAKLRKHMQSELKHLRKRLGMTFVFVTHDQEEAFAMSDRIVVMGSGTIEQVGRPVEVYEEPANLYVAEFVGETNFLEAEVVSCGAGHMNARVMGRDCGLATDSEFPPGTMVSVLLRPEDLLVERKPPEEDDSLWLPGVVEDTIYKGATYDIEILLDGGKRLVVTEFFDEDSEKMAVSPGERVVVSWIKGWEVVLAGR